MLTHEREGEIAMMLARRAYLYSMLHVVFGSEPDRERTVSVFGDETTAAFAETRDALAGEEWASVAARRLGESGRSLAECVQEALSCVEAVSSQVGDEAFWEQLRSDYRALFLVPGDSFVRPWESPYTGKEAMLFQVSTLDVRSFYHEAGLKLQSEKHFPDDHIAAMMDYLGRTARDAYEAYADGRDDEAARLLETQRSFLEKHVLTWIDAFADAVIAHDAHAAYGAFAGGAAAFARLDCARMGALAAELSNE